VRELANAQKVQRFVDALGRACGGPGCVYLVGGATAVLIGWRENTVDVDIKLDPEPPGAFQAIASLKEQLDINVELSSPDAFVPPIPGWRERSPFIVRVGQVDFRHYDLYTQAFAKIERGHTRDIADVRAMIEKRYIDLLRLEEYVRAMLPKLERYPHLDEASLREKLDVFVDKIKGTP
jgi:hypothetical protein